MARKTRASKAGSKATVKPSPAPKTRVLFYGKSNKDGYLSQMYESNFEHQGRKYVCSEQFFQYAKAALFGDTKRGDDIMATTDPYKHKSLGDQVASFDTKRWDEVAYKVVLKATYLKFTISAKASLMRVKLLETGDLEIVEASEDKTWGCGMKLARAGKFDGDEWPGKNLLGKAIMEVRSQLRKEEEDKMKEKEEVDKAKKKEKAKANQEDEENNMCDPE